MKKRFLAILLVCMMVIGMLPTTALAAGTASNNAVKVELVKDRTTFSGKEVLRVDFYAKSGTDKPDNHMVYLKYDASKLYPAAQKTGADASSAATNFSISNSGIFTRNNFSIDDGFGGEMGSEVMFYTIITGGYGYICWKVTEPYGTPPFADYTHISSCFFGLKEGTTFDALPSDAIDYHNPATDKNIVCVNAVAITVNGGGEGNVFNWRRQDGSAGNMTVTPTVNAGEGVTLVEPPKPALEGSVTISGTPKIGETLTATPSITSTTPGTLTYKWYRGETLISGATGNTYIPNDAADVGKTIKVEVSAENYSGSVTSIATAAVTKADYSGSGATVATVNKTANSVTVTNVTSGQEYAITTGSSAPTEGWNTTGKFTGLNANTAYKVYTRVAATATTSASAAVSTDVTTDKSAASITIAIPGTITYDGSAVEAGTSGKDLNYTYTGDGTVTVKWYADNSGSKGSELTGGAPKNAGTYWIGISATEGTSSAAVSEVTKKFTIAPKSISGATITLGTQATYNGTAQNVVITSVKVGEMTLASGTDYDITVGGNATNVENTTLTIKGKGNYDGTKTATWSLQKATPTAADFNVTTPTAVNYDGSAKAVAAPTLKSGKTGAGTITVKYADSATVPTNAGSYAVTFDVAAGTNYNAATGLSIGTLIITAKNASDLTVSAPDQTTVVGVGTFNDPVVTFNGTTVEGTYKYAYDSETNKSHAEVVEMLKTKSKDAEVTLTGTFTPNSTNFTGTKTFTLKVTVKDIEFKMDSEAASAANAITELTADTVYGKTWNQRISLKSGIVASVGETTKAGTYTIVPGTGVLTDRPDAGSQSYTVKFTSTDGTYTNVTVFSGTISVTAKEVTVAAGSYKVSKEYDGDTTAGTASGELKVTGILDSDSVTVKATPVAYSDANVGGQTTMNVTIALDGTGASNYQIKDGATTLAVPCEITPKAISINAATATDRYYAEGDKSVTISAVTFTGEAGTMTKDTDYTVTGVMDDDLAGTGKPVKVTVVLKGDAAKNYTLDTRTTTTTVTINQVAYSETIARDRNVRAGVAAEVEVDMTPLIRAIPGAKATTATEGTDFDSIIASVESTVTDNIVKFMVPASAAVGKTATINVTITSTNYTPITATITVKMVDKENANVTISGAPTSKTYGDAPFTVTAQAGATGAHGSWTWTVSSGGVLTITNEATATPTLTIAKAGTATVKAEYSSDDTVGEAVFTVEVHKATITVAAKNQSIYVNGTVPDLTSPVKDTHYTVTGLASGDTLGGTLTMKYQKDGVDATPDATKTGTYDIVISGATAPAGGNYNDVVFTAGTLTISNKPSSSGGGVSTYSITAEPTEHGTISVSRKNASKGSTVTVTVKPDEGYELDALAVTNRSGKAVTVTEKDGKYTFIMPASKVSVKATFKEAEKPVTMPFTDVAEGAWYYDSIKYVYSNGMMVGTGDTKFSPNATTTRGMIVTILYRLEGEPAVSGASSFNDVAEGKYYANAVKWAAENEIVGGYGNGQFGPEDPITREQMAAILYRYAAFKGLDMTKTADLSKFTDSDKISDWSKAALSWANAEGLVNGKGGGILDPLGNATRAEVSAILYRFCENVVK